MTVTIKFLANAITPERTALLFGAGASIPSGAPSTAALCGKISEGLNLEDDDLSFAQLCSLFEIRKSRRDLVTLVREQLKNLRPTGGLLNLPAYKWASLYTTNYDELVEKAYLRAGAPFRVVVSNFDFSADPVPDGVDLFKVHGTLGRDTSEGGPAKMVLTEADNDEVEEYREFVYDRLKNDLNQSDLIVIGQSLADPDLRVTVDRAIKLKRNAGSNRQIYLLLHKNDQARIELYEARGIQVCVASIDDFFLELERNAPQTRLIASASREPLTETSVLNATCVDVAKALLLEGSEFARVFSGTAADYSDIAQGFTFKRELTQTLLTAFETDSQFAMIIGVSGVGKTTLARQLLAELSRGGAYAWEHKIDAPFLHEEWKKVAERLKANSQTGYLLIDEAHVHLPEINLLVDWLCASENQTLRLVLVSAKNHWRPRVKNPGLFRKGKVHEVSKLSPTEIDRLLNFVDTNSVVKKLVEKSFGGYSKSEKKRRLVERCSRDFFVCLKNIFASDAFDEIILREYAQINDAYRDTYKFLCAMESFGVRVHRQLVVRLLGIPAQDVGIVLDNLDGLIEEYPVDERRGVYGWRGRHSVISAIISDHKFAGQEETRSLLRQVIQAISPTYDLEIRTLRQLCSYDGGLARLSSQSEQNELLRMMISVAPKERVPRHRLIGNLINHGQFADAETEIRIFENDLGKDGPVRRHKVRLILERAMSNAGLLAEDKAALLNKAYAAATRLVERDALARPNLQLFADVSIELYRSTGDYAYLDEALRLMREAESELSDPEITRMISRFENRVTPVSGVEFESVEDVDLD